MSDLAPTATITIRPAAATDGPGLDRLADLDSAEHLPPAPLLVAEVDGELRVAISLRNSDTIADPFFPTRDVVALLRTQAAATTGRGARRGLSRQGLTLRDRRRPAHR